MVTSFDKRSAKGHGCDGEIIWSYFNKKDYFKEHTLKEFQ